MQDQDTYRVRLEIFEGPLDLLLFLIRKNEVDVYDIPISMIVEQYMEYLDLMRSLDLDVAGDFLVMAATLSHIKSQTLLPRSEDDTEDEEEGEDPRAELVRKLLDYERFKEVAEELGGRSMLGRDVYTREPSREMMVEAAHSAGLPEVTFKEVGVFELLEALKDVVERTETTTLHEVTMERVSIVDRINDIMNILREEESIGFDQLFTEATDRPTIITTFLALLELVRLKVIKAYQDSSFGPITLVRAVIVDDKWITENLPGIEKGNE